MGTSFTLDNRTDKKGDAPIRVIICVSGQSFKTSAGYIPSKIKRHEKRHKNDIHQNKI